MFFSIDNPIELDDGGTPIYRNHRNHEASTIGCPRRTMGFGCGDRPVNGAFTGLF